MSLRASPVSQACCELWLSWLTAPTPALRLIKGDGEVLEEIVTKERHREINKVGAAPLCPRASPSAAPDTPPLPVFLPSKPREGTAWPSRCELGCFLEGPAWPHCPDAGLRGHYLAGGRVPDSKRVLAGTACLVFV